MSEKNKIKEVIENRAFVRIGDLIFDKQEYINYQKTHCHFCRKEVTKLNAKSHFNELCCEQCKKTLDPDDIYSKIKDMKGFKVQLK